MNPFNSPCLYSYLLFFSSFTKQWRCLRSVQIQGAKIEGEGAYLRYVTEPEYRKQRSSWAFIRHRPNLFSSTTY
jgi:hypothetical protein